MNFVIYGNDEFLLNNRLNSLKKKYAINEENMNCITYWCNETPMREILDDALTFPFLSDYKMVIVKNPWFLTTKKQKEVSDEDVTMLIDYLENDNPTTLLVFYGEDLKLDQRKKVVKTLKKTAKFYNCEKLTPDRLMQVVRDAFKKRHCSIDDDALDLFLSRKDNDLMAISKDVEKLSLYSHHITKEDINLLVSKKLEDKIFELTNAYMAKDIKRSFEIYQDLIKQNEEPIRLIVSIGNSLRLLYQVRFLDRKGYNDQEIAQMLSINPYRLKYIRQEGQAFDLNEIVEKLDELSDLDIKIKSGKVDKYKGLELFLLRMKGEDYETM